MDDKLIGEATISPEGLRPASAPKAVIELRQVRNPQRSEASVDPGSTELDVVDVFDTVQGEGPFAGRRAIFVRLAGCNIRCDGCDTDYTTGRRKLTPDQLLLEVNDLVVKNWRLQPFVDERKLVVITGGEPFRQPAVLNLVQLLDATLFTVQIETNGTVCPPELDETIGKMHRHLWLVVSPKRDYLAPQFTNRTGVMFKYVVEHGQVDPADGLPTSVLGMPFRPARPSPGWFGKVYVQPMEDVNPDRTKKNVEQAVESCRKFGYILCLQQHKLVGLP